jgi:hypothetical protein
MKLEQNQEQTLVQILKMKLLVGCLLIFFIIGSVATVSGIRNIIRSYKPLPTSSLRHQ